MTVYFIKPIGMDGPIKIGCSQYPGKRLSSLETWCPFPLEIVAQIEGDVYIERRFHRKFLDTHLRSEWFEATDDLLDTIRQINAGQFQVSSLPAYGGPINSMKATEADYSPIDLKFIGLHHTLLSMPYSVRWAVYRNHSIPMSISAFVKLRPETKRRHLSSLSTALESAAA